MKRIFLSSVVTGLENLRDAADRGIRAVAMETIRSEQFGARPDTPERACLDEVRGSDGMVLLIGARYGDVQGSGRSATHEEYLEARTRCPVLVFVQSDVDRDPKQQEFLDEIRAWDAGQITASFESVEQLQELVTQNLHRLEVALTRGPASETDLLGRCDKLLTQDRNDAALVVAVVGSPIQEILRPAEIERRELADNLTESALFGSHRVLDSAKGSTPSVSNHSLRIAQDDAWVSLGENGDISVGQNPLTASAGDRHRTALVEEDIMLRISNALAFVGTTLDTIDHPRRMTDVCIGVALLNSGHAPWFTRSEAQQHANSWTLGRGSERIVVYLSPPVRKRSMLIGSASEWAEDFMTLLRREQKSS